ncbi:energy-coupling factor transporter ATPase [Anaerobranca gottschalkii]|uniref:ABC transporter ATP-binding protein n=1 Tax=Anaerobranca gottschalkii DSM 13577 TaxID=1120990 RepID=A0A1I0A4Y2_9FIRM|nr:energy-coupling factor transporter ATPase [Anaerobranca gottschalkii]SES89229.1 energy-coupling factor transport system ATP-binding protein [Anaerobranca gottschalkii DSM 13577]
MGKIIEVKNLVHYYNKDKENQLAALKGVNLSIEEGEFVVIIGHNGSGKSTLAKHFNGLLEPHSGEVYIEGKLISSEEDYYLARQTVGLVFQNPDNQIIATIVEEDVAFGPENLGLPQEVIIQRVDEALKLVRMEGYRKHPPHLLSGGQKQRIAIAGILAMLPKCICLDEPTAMLDPQGRREVMETISRLNKEQGITIVHITHHMEEAALADRVIVMENGEIVMEGTPKEIFKDVEKLRELGLDVPVVTELVYDLNKEGYNIPKDIITVEELVKYLCP